MASQHCDGCSTKFSWLRKKRNCQICHSTCCSSCMQRVRYCSVGTRCLRCVRLGTVRYERSTLQAMPIKDLKHIMKIANVSAATCREKSDLIDTILTCERAKKRSGAPVPHRVELAQDAATRPPRVPLVDHTWASSRDSSIRVGPYESIRVRAIADPPGQAADFADARPDSPADLADVQPQSPAADLHSSSDSAQSQSAGSQPQSAGHRSQNSQHSGTADPPSQPVSRDGTDDDDDDDDCVLMSWEAGPGVGSGGGAATDAGPASQTGEALPDTAADGADGYIVVDDDPPADGWPPEGDSVLVVDELDEPDDPDEPASRATACGVAAEGINGPEEGVAAEPEIDLSTLTDVAQLPSEHLISQLTVRQCKQLLHHRRTEYRDVIEKQELLRRVRLLWRETKNNRDELASAPERDICKICMDSLVDCVLLECGHMATCTACGKQMSECPICRQYVVRVVHVFRS